MGTKILHLKENDVQPYYYVAAKDSDGYAINLTGATIRCTMRNEGSGALKISRQTAGVTVTDAQKGEFHYEWQTADTDTAGTYTIEFEVTPAAGGKFTLPANPKDKANVKIHADLDNT